MRFFAFISFAVLMGTYPLFGAGKGTHSLLCRIAVQSLALAMGIAELANPVYSLRVVAHATAVSVLIFAVFTVLFRALRQKYFPAGARPSLKIRFLDIVSLFILVLAFSGFARIVRI